MDNRNRNLLIAGAGILVVFACITTFIIAGALSIFLIAPNESSTAEVDVRIVETSPVDGNSETGNGETIEGVVTPEVARIPTEPPGESTATPAPEATPSPPMSSQESDALSRLADVVIPTRDLRDLARRLRPDVEEIPLVVNDAAPTYEVGDEETFWVSDVDANEQFEITAELIYRTDVAYAWVEKDEDHDRRRISRSVDKFSQDAYPVIREFFGSEWSPGVDNDPRVHILHANGLGRFVAGYYSSADEFSRLANEFSNEKEMFYISLDWLNRSQDYNTYETVLAHEFQHMVHWYNDRNEESWVNEGLSELAQEIVGYPPDTRAAMVYASRPDTQLNTWSDNPAGNSEHYGSAYLFMAYVLQRFGEEVTQSLVAHPANSITGVSEAMADTGYDLGFDDIFADWVIANYVDDPDALDRPGVYGYRQLSAPQPNLDIAHFGFPVGTRNTDVRNYGVDYIGLQGQGDITFYFEGETETSLANVEAYSGRSMLWANRGDDSNSRLTRSFDFSDIDTDTPIEMTVRMWHDIEVDYDYGYVLASVDGEKWDILPGQTTTLANPSGNSFGHAYTGQSGTDEPAWKLERFDLSAYAGQDVQIRFEYVTDDAVNYPGWFVDDVVIPAIDYRTDFETEPTDWLSEGWYWTNNDLPQQWLLQVMTLNRDNLISIQQVPVGEDGQATVEIDGLGGSIEAVITVSGRTPFTTEPAEYLYRIEER